MEASAARRAKRSGHAGSEGQDARSDRPATEYRQPRPTDTANGSFCSRSRVRTPGGVRHIETQGLSVHREPGYGSKRSPEGEAQRTCRKRRAGCPQRPSGDGASAAPINRHGHGSFRSRSRVRTPGGVRHIETQGLPVLREPGYGSKRSPEGEAQRTCRKRRAGCPQRPSGDGASAAPINRHGHGSFRSRSRVRTPSRAPHRNTGAVGAPGAGLWKQAQPGGRSAADMQEAKGRMPAATVRRRSTGSPGQPTRSRVFLLPIPGSHAWRRAPHWQRGAAGAPGAGLWKQAQPGGRSAADMQEAKGRMPAATVR